jgi:hypothetical protein
VTISSDLERLPPQAVTVLRCLAAQEGRPISVEAIAADTGLSAVGVGKGIRPLVTRRYATMTQPGHYALTPAGREAARGLVEVPQAVGEPAAQAQAQRPERVHVRRLSVFMPCELSLDTPSSLQVGFDPPDQGQSPLPGLWPLMLRLRADGCDVSPESHPLALPPQGVGGPVRFRVIPQIAGTHRFRLEVLGADPGGNRRLLGGMYFDLNVAEFPTPACAQFQALGADISLPLEGDG